MATPRTLLTPTLFMEQHAPLYDSVDWLNSDYNAYYASNSPKSYTNNLIADLSLTAGAPTALTADSSGKNTRVAYSSTSKLISGVSNVFYDRLDIAKAFAAEGISPSLVPNGLNNWRDVITALCEKYAVVLPADAAPLTPFPIDLNGLETIELNLTDSQSYVMTGTLSIAIEIPSLVTAVAHTSLPGLIGPAV